MKRLNAARPVNPDTKTGRENLHNPDTRDQALADLGQWVIDTCMMFGCQPETAWLVASTFARGLRRELEAKDA